MKDSPSIARSITLLLSIAALGALLALSGCGGGQSMASPGVYAGQPKDDTTSETTTPAPERDDDTGPLSYRYDKGDDEHDPGTIPDEDSLNTTTSSKRPIGHGTKKGTPEPSRSQGMYTLQLYNEDSAAAVDDDICRPFDLA